MDLDKVGKLYEHYLGIDSRIYGRVITKDIFKKRIVDGGEEIMPTIYFYSRLTQREILQGFMLKAMHPSGILAEFPYNLEAGIFIEDKKIVGCMYYLHHLERHPFFNFENIWLSKNPQEEYEKAVAKADIKDLVVQNSKFIGLQNNPEVKFERPCQEVSIVTLFDIRVTETYYYQLKPELIECERS